ncbi:MAG: hypothetical protein IJ174_03890 [Clostridia bacterium]|nr:hypothetical protein [Clostridia bacterium]
MLNDSALVFAIVALILALAGTVAIHLLILPASKRPYLSPVLQRCADFFNLRTLYLEKILKAIYIFLNLAVILCAIGAVFTVKDIGVPVGILSLVLGPLLLRLLHESIMLRVLEVRNVQEINRRLAGPEEARAAKPAEEAQGRRRRNARESGQRAQHAAYGAPGYPEMAQQPYAEPAQTQNAQAYPDYAQPQNPQAYPDYAQPQQPAYPDYSQSPQQAQPYPAQGQNAYPNYQQPYYSAYPQQPYGQQENR